MSNQEVNKQARYNLNVVVKETGIKADALRAWEKRYNLPQPARSPGGHRLYSDYDIQVIKWIQARQKEGLRISQAADYWKELINSGVDPLNKPSSVRTGLSSPREIFAPNQNIIQLREKWIQYILDFDEVGAEQVLSQAFAQFPLEEISEDLISSGLNSIGNNWYDGTSSVQQEHFASELAIRKLQALLASAPRPIQQKTILIFCPAGENHFIPILILNLLLRYRGWETIFLGANVPLSKLSDTIIKIKPDLAVLSASRLPTAAALLDSALLLAENQIPAVYGGKIFIDIPDLADHIPAHHLNTGLRESIPSIENIIKNPALGRANKPVSTLGSAARFNKNRFNIDNAVIQYYSKLVSQDQLEDIQEANVFLAQEILSAQKFGNLDYINPDLVWLEGLLCNRKQKKGLLLEYLEQYQIAVESYLREEGAYIKTWLAGVILTHSQTG